MKRTLAPDEAALWKRVIETVTPLRPAKAAPQPPLPAAEAPAAKRAKPVSFPQVVRAPLDTKPPRARPPVQAARDASNTLDASWDRKLSRGIISPESSIDLHGHSLSAAYDRLDRGLEQAIGQGDRVLLLVTGKPPRPESERPHARGAIRAAVGDWLASSRHADRIAAVRTAHPRHGGTGALYIILRRPRGELPRKS